MNKKRKKILLYTRPIAPPWDEASKNLAFEIACKAGGSYEFRVVTTKKFAKDLNNFVINKHEKKVIPEQIFSTEKFDLNGKIKLLLRLFKPNLNADIIHFMFTPRLLTSILTKFRLLFSKTKTIQTIASIDDEIRGNYSKLKKILFADMIIAQTVHTSKILEHIGFNNVQVIYPGIDVGKFIQKSKNESMMRELGIANDEFVVLFAGEYSRLQATDDIVGAMEKLIGKEGMDEKKYKFIFACRIKSNDDLAKKHQIIKTLQQKGLDGSAIFLDMCKDMVSLYGICDISIFPARKMAGKVDIPLVIIESMITARPVIISDIPVLMEIVKDQTTGLVIKKANSHDLAQAIKKLNKDPQLCQRLGTNALEYAKEKFDITKNVKFYEKIYNSL